MSIVQACLRQRKESRTVYTCREVDKPRPGRFERSQPGQSTRYPRATSSWPSSRSRRRRTRPPPRRWRTAALPWRRSRSRRPRSPGAPGTTRSRAPLRLRGCPGGRSARRRRTRASSRRPSPLHSRRDLGGPSSCRTTEGVKATSDHRL